MKTKMTKTASATKTAKTTAATKSSAKRGTVAPAAVLGPSLGALLNSWRESDTPVRIEDVREPAGLDDGTQNVEHGVAPVSAEPVLVAPALLSVPTSVMPAKRGKRATTSSGIPKGRWTKDTRKSNGLLPRAGELDDMPTARALDAPVAGRLDASLVGAVPTEISGALTPEQKKAAKRLKSKARRAARKARKAAGATQARSAQVTTAPSSRRATPALSTTIAVRTALANNEPELSSLGSYRTVLDCAIAIVELEKMLETARVSMRVLLDAPAAGGVR